MNINLDKAHPMRDKIATAIAEDIRCRVPGVTEGLYGIESLVPFERLTGDMGIPVITQQSREKLFCRVTTDAQFAERLTGTGQKIATFDFAAHGMVMAGGAVSALLMRDEAHDLRQSFSDFDCFLVGHRDDASARSAIVALATHLNEGETVPLEVFRTANCITFRLLGHGWPVQVILRQYATAAEVIHGFDMGSSAVLWDGRAVRMTAMGLLAANHGINVLNLAARRGSYEKRLSRYFERGFDIVLPHLDVVSFIAANGEMPYLRARPTYACKGSSSVSSSLLVCYNVVPMNSHQAPNSEYQADSYMPYHDRARMNEKNVEAAQRGQPGSYCAAAEWSAALDIFNLQPQLCPVQLAESIVYIFSKSSVSAKKLTRLVGSDHAAALMLDYFAAGLKLDEASAKAVSHQVCKNLAPKATIPFNFMPVLGGTALTGPFTRQLVTTEEWYGPMLFGRLGQ